MNNLCIIPARGGSKRIPRKNIKLFQGKPIIAHTIQHVMNAGLFNEVMVSTDDEEIKQVALKFGAKVPFTRSEENSNDFATLSDVLMEVLANYQKLEKKFDHICCVLPTSILITPALLDKSFRLLDNNTSTVLPVLRFSYPIQRALKNKEGYLFMSQIEHINTRTQDLETHFHDSGQFYWLKTSDFIKEKKIFTTKTRFIELKEYEAQDIDTPEDWEMLELKYKLNQSKHEKHI